MKYIKLFEQEYSIYDIITMTPGHASEVLFDEIKESNPDMELIKNLLEHSWIDVNVQDEDGWSALMWASELGHTEIVKGLLNRPEIDVNLQDEEDNSAIEWAWHMDHTEIAELIESHPNFNPDL